ncbi:MAG: hypothetical protein WC481_07140 [Candidatus Omnitrophota bacterium]
MGITEADMKGITRREFLKRNFVLAAAVLIAGGLVKALSGVFGRKANVSDKEARYYKTLAG